eukprot:762433-Hanusia_phi.AAC.20
MELAGHGRQASTLFAPTNGWYVSYPHSWQRYWPDLFWKVPGWQDAQTVAAKSSDAVPAGHAVHIRSDASRYDPGRQAVHSNELPTSFVDATGGVGAVGGVGAEGAVKIVFVRVGVFRAQITQVVLVAKDVAGVAGGAGGLSRTGKGARLAAKAGGGVGLRVEADGAFRTGARTNVGYPS